MAQQRFHVEWFHDFTTARQFKLGMLAEKPDKVLQIRKRNQGARYELVERVPLGEVLKNPDNVVKTRRRHRHGKGADMNGTQNN